MRKVSSSSCTRKRRARRIGIAEASDASVGSEDCGLHSFCIKAGQLLLNPVQLFRVIATAWT